MHFQDFADHDRFVFGDQVIQAQKPLPGVVDYLNDAKRLGLKLAIASSSDRNWVNTHAKRIGVFDYFDRVITSEDVAIGRIKPNPDLFLTALNRLQVQKEAAIVFEDSPNGVKAANRAGIFVVAVPNSVTAKLSMQGANMILSSLSEMSLSQLLDTVK